MKKNIDTLKQFTTQSSLVHVLALALLTLLTRLPFRSAVLLNWDSVNFALGVLDLDVVKHRPHPPGYIWYVGLGRILTYFTGDPNTGLVWLSILTAVLTVVLTYLLGRRLFGPGDALVAGLLLASSPLFWFNNEIALTYTPEAFFSIAIAYACYRIFTGSTPWAYAAALLLGVAGGVRQTTLLFLLPLVIYAVWQLPWRHRLASGTMTIAVCLAWGLPLVANTGGLGAYLAASSLLAACVEPVPFSYLFQSLFYGLHLVLPLQAGWILGLYTIDTGHRPARERPFLLVWILPGLFIAAFRHMGQSGYILYALPAIFIYTPALLRGALRKLEKVLGAAGESAKSELAPKYVLTVLILILVGAATFLLGAYRTIDLQEEHWQTVQELADRYPPGETQVLAAQDWFTGFRHASYYMPDYHVYGFISEELDVSFPAPNSEYILAWLYHAHQHEDNYDLDPEGHSANTILELPPGTQGLLVTNPALVPYRQGNGGEETGSSLPASLVSINMLYVELPEGSQEIVVAEGRLYLR
jgi:hypothetical protein